jgi:hypothetical protein
MQDTSMQNIYLQGCPVGSGKNGLPLAYWFPGACTSLVDDARAKL